jgi:hypothetical protein
MGIHLGPGAEDDAVAIDDVDLTIGLDGSKDLGRDAGGVVDDIEDDPVAGLIAGKILVELEEGVKVCQVRVACAAV